MAEVVGGHLDLELRRVIQDRSPPHAYESHLKLGCFFSDQHLLSWSASKPTTSSRPPTHHWDPPSPTTMLPPGPPTTPLPSTTATTPGPPTTLLPSAAATTQEPPTQSPNSDSNGRQDHYLVSSKNVLLCMCSCHRSSAACTCTVQRKRIDG
jgi:hypothetical protein